MDKKIEQQILDSLDAILVYSLMSGNFPFDKSCIQKKFLIKKYLTLHIIQNRLLTFLSPDISNNGYKGIMIGCLAKTYEKKSGKTGDYSNLFIKEYLNEKGIKTAEILIPNLRDIFLLKYLFRAKDLAKDHSFILSYPRNVQIGKLSRSVFKNKILKKIEQGIHSSDSDTAWQSREQLSLLSRAIESYIGFIESRAVIKYLSMIAVGLDNAFKQIKPDFVIVNSLSGFKDRIAAFVAHKNNIRVLFIPHGIGGSIAIPRYITEDELGVNHYFSANYGTKQMSEIREQNKILHLGPLWLGYLIKARNKIIKKKEKKYSTALYVSQPFSKDKCITEKEYISFLMKTFKTFKELQKKTKLKWLIKLHPRDDINFYRKILKKVGLEIKLLTKPSSICIEDLQNLSPDIVVSPYSTFAMEMIILRKIVIGLLPQAFKEKFFPNDDYSKATIPLHPNLYTEHNLQDFKKLILELLDNKEKAEEKRKKQENFMKEKGIWLDNNSLDNFLYFINSIVKK
jgi:hypothetical protein